MTYADLLFDPNWDSLRSDPRFGPAATAIGAKKVISFLSPAREFCCHSTFVIDRIHIEQLEIYARVGVPESERAEPQRLVLNVTLWPKKTRPRDNIADTVNYSEVAAAL